MDPDATLAIIRDRTASLVDRFQAVVDLQNWLANGGFAPANAAPGMRRRINRTFHYLRRLIDQI